MVAVPAVRPEITPVVELMVATAVLLLVHAPPVLVEAKVVEPPTQIA